MPKVEERVIINSASELQHHFDSLTPSLNLMESEDTWQKIEKSLIKLEVITKSGGYKYDTFPALFKSVAQPIINSLLSERTKLSGTAADLLNSVAPRLGERFESLVHVFTPSLLLICARTNKVALVRAKKCLLLIAKHCKLISLLPHLREASRDKSQTARSVAVEVTLMLLESIEGKEKVGKRVADLESIIKGTATDRDPEVRQWCKKLFEVYTENWPERVMDFTSTFTPTTRRYLALSKSASAPVKMTTQLSPPPVARRQQQPKEHIVKLKAMTVKPRAHLAPISANAHSATSAAISPLAHKQQKPIPVPAQPPKPKAKSQRTPSTEVVQKQPSTSRKASATIVKEVDPAEEQQRAALRAELLKQATGTPSQSVAARLALEKFEFQLKKAQHLPTQDEEEDTHQPVESTQSQQNDRMLFNVAMSKKQSPRKGPSRVIVTAPKNASRKASKEVTASTSSSTLNGPTPASKVVPKIVEAEEPDVFRSRPIGNVRALQPISASSPKVSSSISRGLGAREKLLGPSMRAANRAKVINAKAVTSAKKSSLKIDLGKENIPPGSMLAQIAEPPSEPATPTEDVPTEHVLEGQEPTPARITTTETTAPVLPLPEKIEPIQLDEIKGSTEAEERKEEVKIEAPASLAIEGEKEDESQKEREEAPVEVAADAVNIEAEVNPIVVPLPPSSDVVIEAETPLSDWTLMSAALQEDIPLSAPAKSDEGYSAKMRGPSMSTPLRKPLGAMQYNSVVSSLSSPLRSVIAQATNKDSSLSIQQTSSPKKEARATPSAHLRKIFSIVASRKM